MCSKSDSTFIIDGGPPVYEPTSKGLGCELFYSLDKHSQEVAVYTSETDASILYEVIRTRSVRMAMRLLEKGFAENDIICNCGPNDENSCIPMVASFFTGCIFNAFEINQSPDAVKYILDYLKPKMFFISNDQTFIAEELLKEVSYPCEIVTWEKSDKYLSLQDLIQPIVGEEMFKPKPVKDYNNAAILALSSGTTSNPKGVCLTHKSFLAQSVIMCDLWKLGNNMKLKNFNRRFDYNHQFVFMTSSPMYWITGSLFCVCSIIGGMARVVSKIFDATTFCKNIEKYKVNAIMVQPTQAYELFACNQWKYIHSNSLQSFFMGGSVVTETLRRNLESAFPTARICAAYGQTEAGGCILGYNFNREEDLKLLKTNAVACGRPVSSNKYKVVDLNTGESLGPFEKGELKIKSNFYSKGYYHKNAESIFDKDGWMSTGDLFYYDENNCFYVIDRIKDLIRYKTLSVNPSEIENILIQHPSVEECFVLGYPDQINGELPMAVISLKNNEKNITEKDICKFVEDKLPDKFHLRGGVKFVETFIKTPLGKIKKLEMKKRIIKKQI